MAERSGGSGSGEGIGFIGMLTILFIGLKLCGVINWSWLWVLSPIWIAGAAIMGILLIVFGTAGILGTVRSISNTRRYKKTKRRHNNKRSHNCPNRW